MSKHLKRIGQLQLEEDMRHQRHEWRAEQIGWALMLLVLIGAVAGLLGPGPLSQTVAGTEGSTLWVDYQRIARYQAPAELRIHFRNPDPGGEDGRLSLNRDFYEAVEIQTISPLPKSTLLTHDRVQFVFPADTRLGATAVTFHFHPIQRWRRPVSVSLDGGERRDFSIFVLP